MHISLTEADSVLPVALFCCPEGVVFVVSCLCVFVSSSSSFFFFLPRYSITLSLLPSFSLPLLFPPFLLFPFQIPFLPQLSFFSLPPFLHTQNLPLSLFLPNLAHTQPTIFSSLLQLSFFHPPSLLLRSYLPAFSSLPLFTIPRPLFIFPIFLPSPVFNFFHPPSSLYLSCPLPSPAVLSSLPHPGK